MYMSTRERLDAGSIRSYLRTHYFEPARRKRETLVTLRAGDIHRALSLRNRVANVCQVMESKLLEKEAGVRISSKQGPPSGRGTTFTVTYVVDLLKGASVRRVTGHESPASPAGQHPGIALFYAMRGKGKEIFAAEGGGESWLARERAGFYSPAQKDLE